MNGPTEKSLYRRDKDLFDTDNDDFGQWLADAAETQRAVGLEAALRVICRDIY